MDGRPNRRNKAAFTVSGAVLVGPEGVIPYTLLYRYENQNQKEDSIQLPVVLNITNFINCLE